MKAIVASMELLMALALFSIVFLTFMSGAATSQESESGGYVLLSNAVYSASELQSAVFLSGRMGMNLSAFEGMANNTGSINITAISQNDLMLGHGRLVVLQGRTYIISISR